MDKYKGLLCSEIKMSIYLIYHVGTYLKTIIHNGSFTIHLHIKMTLP